MKNMLGWINVNMEKKLTIYKYSPYCSFLVILFRNV